MGEENRFPKVVSDKLQCYVYRLVDPRSGVTFYVGRGRGDRVFSHAAGDENFEAHDEAKSMKMDLKMDLIREIKKDDFLVEHVIHRHGMTEEIAKEVEAALIDAYPGLTNIQVGHDSQRGAKHAKQVIRQYKPEVAIFTHKVILIKIDQSLKKDRKISIIDAVRYAWKIDQKRANKADYVLAVEKGVIVGVYVADKPGWLPATHQNFPGLPMMDSKRFGFLGHEAPEDVKAMYTQKLVPPLMHGAANPIQYVPKTLSAWK